MVSTLVEVTCGMEINMYFPAEDDPGPLLTVTSRDAKA